MSGAAEAADAAQAATAALGTPDGPAVGFLGPRGSFSEVAASRLTGAHAGSQVAVPSIINLIQAIAAGSILGGAQRIDAGVLPIENSTEGSVGATLDTLVDHENLVITAELDLPIEQLLVARTGLALDQITQIYSHPQGIAQTRRFVAEHMPQAGVVPVSSTSRSVELVVDSSEPWAAIGSRRAAELYGAVVLRDDIQEQVNVTRFVLVERREDPIGLVLPPAGTEGAPAAARKTTLFFEGVEDTSPGWLVRCLSELAFRGVNLSKIESRPLRGELGHYRFFLDLEGDAAETDVAAAIDGLGHHCTVVRILGSYAVAQHT